MPGGRGWCWWWCKLLCNITGLEHSNEVIMVYFFCCKHLKYLFFCFLFNFDMLHTDIFSSIKCRHISGNLKIISFSSVLQLPAATALVSLTFGRFRDDLISKQKLHISQYPYLFRFDFIISASENLYLKQSLLATAVPINNN